MGLQMVPIFRHILFAIRPESFDVLPPDEHIQGREDAARPAQRRVGLLSHEECLLHRPPVGHPESPSRFEAVSSALSAPAFSSLIRIEAPVVSDRDLLAVHPRSLVDSIEASAPQAGKAPVALDPDTWLSSGSIAAAKRAAGAVVEAVDQVVNGTLDAAFCAVRPPGHHAEPDRAMGFCIWNSVAIGAMHARNVLGLDRVVVVDFDVHHGNGSQAIAETDRNFFYVSIHQGGIYPGTGHVVETGMDHNCVNVPVPHGCSPHAWRAAFRSGVIPALERWRPQLILVSAGFDAHWQDPLAGQNLTEADFAWATVELLAIGKRFGANLVSVLEGGYHLEALGSCVRDHVRSLMAG
jgi:acetoin utilization deacetylase AcuC-like enzyme